MNLKDINKDYRLGFNCDTDIQWDNNELNIYIGEKGSVLIKDISKTDAINVSEELLNKWDFSYFLEFENSEEYYNYFNK